MFSENRHETIGENIIQCRSIFERSQMKLQPRFQPTPDPSRPSTQRQLVHSEECCANTLVEKLLFRERRSVASRNTNRIVRIAAGCSGWRKSPKSWLTLISTNVSGLSALPASTTALNPPLPRNNPRTGAISSSVWRYPEIPHKGRARRKILRCDKPVTALQTARRFAGF